MGWKPVQAQYSNLYEHTVTIRVRDLGTGAQQTIVSNRIHPFFVQIEKPADDVQLAATGTDGPSMPISSEGHVYRGPIANGYWVDAIDLKPGYRLLGVGENTTDSSTQWSEVVSVEVEEKPLKAYNITVGGWHTFFIRGADNDDAPAVWVHNCIPNSLNISSKQFGKKLSQRARDLGLDPSSAKVRFKFRSRIQRIFSNADEVRSGIFRGQGPRGGEGPVTFFRRGHDVLATSPTGDFITFLPGGASNLRFLSGTALR